MWEPVLHLLHIWHGQFLRLSGSAHQINKGLQASLLKSATLICISIILILTSQYCLHRFALTVFGCVLTLFLVLFQSLRILILCFISEAQGIFVFYIIVSYQKHIKIISPILSVLFWIGSSDLRSSWGFSLPCHVK